MSLIDKNSILQEIPLFAPLSEEERELIKQRSAFLEHKKGEIIYQEGAPVDAFYCIVLGRIVIYTRAKDNSETILEYLHRGKYFGIISLLTGDAHSVTARVVNDCLLLVIKKEDFNFILNKVPRLAIDLSQTLSRRLKRKDIHQKTIFESTITAVFSSYSQVGKTVYALNLALSLAQETHKSVLIMDIAPCDKMHSLPCRLDIEGDYKVIDLSSSVDASKITQDFMFSNRFGIDMVCFSYRPEDDTYAKRLVDILSFLINDYHYIVLDLPSYMDKHMFDILNQADLIYVLTSPEPIDLQKTHKLIERLKMDFQFQESKIKVITNEYKFSRLTYEQQKELLGHDIFATLPKIDFLASDRLVLDAPNCEYARVIKRISRVLGERLVGLALGVGVAYGFCHIGVLQVIEEENIPVDVIAGSSIGAIIAALWAVGKSSQEILEITREFKEPKYIWSIVDLTFPRLGFIKGNKLYRFLSKYLDNKTFYDVKLPLKIIASDVKRREPRVLDKGLLVDAVMASCAMPGVFTPFKSKEEILLDGGIINPLPTEVLFKMGVRKIIAVNVTPSRQDILRQYEQIKQGAVSDEGDARKKKWFSLRGYLKERFKTNILDIIFSSIELMQSEVAQKEEQAADVVLHPDTSGLYWLELHKAEEFAKRGAEETRRNLDQIWQAINE